MKNIQAYLLGRKYATILSNSFLGEDKQDILDSNSIQFKGFIESTKPNSTSNQGGQISSLIKSTPSTPEAATGDIGATVKRLKQEILSEGSV